jgi:hypothetical protein
MKMIEKKHSKEEGRLLELFYKVWCHQCHLCMGWVGKSSGVGNRLVTTILNGSDVFLISKGWVLPRSLIIYGSFFYNGFFHLCIKH